MRMVKKLTLLSRSVIDGEFDYRNGAEAMRVWILYITVSQLNNCKHVVFEINATRLGAVIYLE